MHHAGLKVENVQVNNGKTFQSILGAGAPNRSSGARRAPGTQHRGKFIHELPLRVFCGALGGAPCQWQSPCVSTCLWRHSRAPRTEITRRPMARPRRHGRQQVHGGTGQWQSARGHGGTRCQKWKRDVTHRQVKTGRSHNCRRNGMLPPNRWQKDTVKIPPEGVTPW